MTDKSLTSDVIGPLWYAGPSFEKRVSWRELADQLGEMPGATATLNLAEDMALVFIALTIIDTRFRVDAEGDQFIISAERKDLPANSWVPLINHVEPLLGPPTN
ncbi:MAG: hypothetical protein H0T21_00765 [Gemmatimonadaceae bacterium]|nr:hypothetical protein [Gemmatimonadaceae bacterium]